MKIILLENIPSLGKAGDRVQVAAGYARNFLIPRKMALEATPANLQHLERQKDTFFKKAGKEKEEAADLATRIEGLSCTLARSAGEQEKLFGSVTSMDLQEFLASQGIQIDRRKIVLPHPIKTLGNFTVPIKLHADVTAQLKVQINPADEEKKNSSPKMMRSPVL